MTSSSKMALDNFLKKYIYKKEGDLDITHTRIGDKKKYLEVHFQFQKIKWICSIDCIIIKYSRKKIPNI